MLFKEVLDWLMTEKRLSIQELSDKSKISYTQIREYLRGSQGNPKAETTEKLCKGLGITPQTFFNLLKSDKTLEELKKEKSEQIQKRIEEIEKTFVKASSPQEQTTVQYIPIQQTEQIAERMAEKLIERIAEQKEDNAIANIQRRIEELESKFQPPSSEPPNPFLQIISTLPPAIQQEVIIPDPTSNIRLIPILEGTGACGYPSAISQDYATEYLPFPESFPIPVDFIISAKGNSMVEEGITDGMLLFIKKQNACNSGDIILLCCHNNGDHEMVIKKAKTIHGITVFQNGKGEIMETTDSIEIIGKIIFKMDDPRKLLK